MTNATCVVRNSESVHTCDFYSHHTLCIHSVAFCAETFDPGDHGCRKHGAKFSVSARDRDCRFLPSDADLTAHTGGRDWALVCIPRRRDCVLPLGFNHWLSWSTYCWGIADVFRDVVASFSIRSPPFLRHVHFRHVVVILSPSSFALLLKKLWTSRST